MSLEQILKSLPLVLVRQKKEIAEIFGFETRNKYSIETEDGKQVAYAAEQQKGILGFLFRQALGHWRRYEIHIFNAERQLEYVAKHPFRFYYQRLEVYTADGREVGALERRFEILGKRFDLTTQAGKEPMTVRSPIWRIWTFPFKRGERECALISKKWGGILKEAFLDADSFALEFKQSDVTGDERAVLLAAAIFVDMRYFEKKASGGMGSAIDLFPNS